MANTKKLTNLVVGNRSAYIYFTLASDGTQETNLVLYDSSVIAGLLGIADPLTCTIVTVRYAAASAAGVVRLNWDATTPVAAWSLPYQSGAGDYNFEYFGGLKNQGGAGITGDVTLTTTGLASGDSLSLVLEVRSN